MGFDVGTFIQQVGNTISQAAQTAVQLATAAGLGLFTAGPGGAFIGVTMAVVDDLVGTHLLNSAADVANLLGIINVKLVYHFLTDLSRGVVNMTQLGNDLAADWQTIKNDEGEAVALTNGDYRKVWDLYTDSGALFDQLPASLRAAIPMPKPDPLFNLKSLAAKVEAGTVDLQDAAVQAASGGYYTQAQAWRTKWRTGLVASPARRHPCRRQGQGERRPTDDASHRQGAPGRHGRQNRYRQLGHAQMGRSVSDLRGPRHRATARRNPTTESKTSELHPNRDPPTRRESARDDQPVRGLGSNAQPKHHGRTRAAGARAPAPVDPLVQQTPRRPRHRG